MENVKEKRFGSKALMLADNDSELQSWITNANISQDEMRKAIVQAALSMFTLDRRADAFHAIKP